jgi:hypothetical protein
MKTFYRTLWLLTILSTSSVHTQNWVRVTEIPADYVYSVIEHSGSLYAATDSVIYKYTNNAWARTAGRPPTDLLNTLYSHSGVLYAGTLGDGVFHSQDDGLSWQNISTGLSGGARSIAEFAVRGDSLFAGTDGEGIYLLNLLNPATWVSYNTGLFQFGGTSIITSGTTLVACLGQYVFVRPRGASQWTDVTVDSILNRTPTRLIHHGPNVFLGTSGGIFRGNAEGTVWQRADITQLPNREISAFASDGSRLYAGLLFQGQHWIFTTENGGGVWDARAHEFSVIFAMKLWSGRLWAARSDGLWSVDLSGWTDVEDPGGQLPAGFLLHQNYPNPFNSTTRISFELPVRSPITLKVVDIQGRHVETLADSEFSEGLYDVRWNAASLSSGTYFYRLTAGPFSKTKRILLLK